MFFFFGGDGVLLLAGSCLFCCLCLSDSFRGGDLLGEWFMADKERKFRFLFGFLRCRGRSAICCGITGSAFIFASSLNALSATLDFFFGSS